MKRRDYYRVHRLLSLFAGVQLLLWCVSGLIFTLHDIDHVRGVDQRADVEGARLLGAKGWITPAKAIETSGLKAVERVSLRRLLDKPVYQVEGSGESRLVSARSGKLLLLNEQDAQRIARADRLGRPEVVNISRVETNPPIEYRDKPLPAWRIELDDGDHTAIWVNATTGVIEARRNDAWRRFDFFWMLHTMDYSGRDDFNHPLLIGFASLGLLSVIAGWVLWLLRFRLRISRRHSK